MFPCDLPNPQRLTEVPCIRSFVNFLHFHSFIVIYSVNSFHHLTLLQYQHFEICIVYNLAKVLVVCQTLRYLYKAANRTCKK